MNTQNYKIVIDFVVISDTQAPIASLKDVPLALVASSL